MTRNTKLKVAAMAGVLALAIATPVAIASAADDAPPPTGADEAISGEICFEVDDPFLGGEFALPDGEWIDGFAMGFDEFEGLDGFDFELPEFPEELLENLEAEARDLAAHLEAAGIEYEVIEEPDGMVWVEWDWDDEAAWEAVDEFYAGREDLFEVFEGEFLFPDDELFDGFDGEFMLEFPEGEMPEGVFEVFEGEWPVHGGLDGEWLEMDWLPMGPSIMCVPAPADQATALEGDLDGLMEALTAAGISFDTETVTLEVPVWDPGDEAAREAAEDYYAGLHEAEFEEFEGWLEFPVDDDGGDGY